MSRPGRKCGHIHAELASPAVEHQSVRVDDAEMLAQQPGAGCRQLRFDMAEMRLYPLRCIGRQTGRQGGVAGEAFAAPDLRKRNMDRAGEPADPFGRLGREIGVAKRQQAGFGMAEGEIGQHRAAFGQQSTVDQRRRNPRHRIDLQKGGEFLLALAYPDSDRLVWRTDLFESDMDAKRASVRRKIEAGNRRHRLARWFSRGAPPERRSRGWHPV